MDTGSLTRNDGGLLNPETEAETQVASKPKLSLTYLIVFFSAFAIVFGFQDLIGELAMTVSPSVPVWKNTFLIVHATTAAICLSGLVFVICEWRRTGEFIRHPGYLLLLVLGISVAMAMISNLTFGISKGADELVNDPSSEALLMRKFLFWRLGFVLATFVSMLLMLLGCFRYRWWWRLFFGLMVLTFVPGFGSQVWSLLTLFEFVETNMNVLVFLAYTSSIILPVTGVCIVICIILDFVTGESRDWLHWLGVLALFLKFVLYPVLILVASRILTPQELYSM